MRKTTAFWAGASKSRRLPVHESIVFSPLGLVLNGKQIPRFVKSARSLVKAERAVGVVDRASKAGVLLTMRRVSQGCIGCNPQLCTF